MSRTALWEDPRTANGNSDNRSGGPSNSPSAKDRNYDLSKGLHTYGVSYPAGLRRPELVPAGTQTAFRLYETISCEGEKKPDNCMACVENSSESLDER